MKIRSKTHHALLSAAALASVGLALPAAADSDFNYDYLGGSWVFADELELDGLTNDLDVDGVQFEASARLVDRVFVRLSGLSLDVDPSEADGFDANLNMLSLGVGYALPLLTGSQSLDVTGELSYERLDLFDDGDGWGATIGARWRPIDRLELYGHGGWRDYGSLRGDDLDGWVYGVGALFSVTEQFAVTADWRRLDLELDLTPNADLDLDTFSVGVRWFFR
ncbi:MAG: outer membrane beta-barrel protein [Pseudomonadales bacterium]